MEAATAFGIAVNALQLVDFGLRLARNLHEIQRTGSLARAKDDEEIAAQLLGACNELTSKTEAADFTKDSESTNVLDLALKCMDGAKDLLGELAKLKTDKRRKWRQTLAIGFRATTTYKVEDIQKRLEKYQAALNTALLINLEQKAKDDENHQDLESARQGFWFEDMHDWEERISETFPQTYKWVLGVDAADPNENYKEVKIYGHKSKHEQPSEPQHRFSDWLYESSSIYWIAGKPGSGKSCLMKYICKHPKMEEFLRGTSSAKTPMILKHFFWKSGSSRQSSMYGMLQTLLYQILQKCPKLGLDVIKKKLIASTLPTISKLSRWHHWSSNDMLDMLDQVMTAYDPGPVLIMIDGLDECLETEQSALLDFISHLSSKQNAKLCVSSRPEKAFATKFENEKRLYLQDLNYEDIKRTVLGTLLPVLCEFNVGENDRARREFAGVVAEKAEGIFLFARLALKDLVSGAQNGDTLQMLKDQLELLPKDLELLFSHLLGRVERRYQKESFEYLQWILHDLNITQEYQLEPYGLTVLHFVFMSPGSKLLKRLYNSDFEYFQSEAFDQICKRTRDRILNCCAGLIEIRSINSPWKNLDRDVGPVGAQSLSFIHRSVSDFFHQSLALGKGHGEGSDMLHARCSSEIAFLGLACHSHIQAWRYDRKTRNNFQQELSTFLRRFLVLITELENTINSSTGQDITSAVLQPLHIPRKLEMVLNILCQPPVECPDKDLDHPDLSSEETIQVDVTSMLANFGLYRQLIDHASLYHVVGSEICSPGLEHLLLCAINGLPDERKTFQQVINHLTTINMLVNLGANPNVCFSTKGGTLFYTETAWTAFVERSCRFTTLTESIMNATSDSVTTQAASSLWLSALTTFLDHGADPDATVFKDVDYSWFVPRPPSNLLLRTSIVAHIENTLRHHCLNTHSRLILMQGLHLLKSRGAKSLKGIAYAQVAVRDPGMMLSGIVYRGNMIEQPTRRLFPVPQAISDQVPDWMYVNLQYQRGSLHDGVVNHIESLFDKFRQEGAKSIDDDDETPAPHLITFYGVETYERGTAGRISEDAPQYKEDAGNENPFRALRDRIRSGELSPFL